MFFGSNLARFTADDRRPGKKKQNAAAKRGSRLEEAEEAGLGVLGVLSLLLVELSLPHRVSFVGHSSVHSIDSMLT